MLKPTSQVSCLNFPANATQLLGTEDTYTIIFHFYLCSALEHVKGAIPLLCFRTCSRSLIIDLLHVRKWNFAHRKQEITPVFQSSCGHNLRTQLLVTRNRFQSDRNERLGWGNWFHVTFASFLLELQHAVADLLLTVQPTYRATY